MSSRTLELDELRLRSTQDKLQLSIRSAATFRFPATISTLEDSDIVKALGSGNICAIRGIGCRLDFRVSIDGELLYRNNYLHILERIGHRIRDASLWSQLHLSSVLDFGRSDRLEEQPPHFSIQINNEPPPLERNADPSAWVLDNADVKPPESVPCAGLETLQVHFDFLAVRDKPSQDTQHFDSGWDNWGSSDVMLLDGPDVCVGGHLEELEDMVGGLSQRLSDSVSRCFEVSNHKAIPEPRGNSAGLPLRQICSPLHGTNFRSLTLGIEETPRRSAQKTAKDKKGILSAWVELHRDNTYPTRDEETALMNETGYARATMNCHLSALRQYLQSSTTQFMGFKPQGSSPEMSIIQREGEAREESDDMLIDQVSDDFGDDDTLLFQLDDPPPLTSISSAASAHSSNFHYFPAAIPSLLHTPTVVKVDLIAIIPLSPACKLSEMALRLLVSGIPNRSHGIKTNCPPSASPLSLLAPAMFSPGFKQSMAHNAHFLSRISGAVCGSWVRNLQGAGLRKKLSLLAECTPLLMEEEVIGEKRSPRRLAAVVQNRLWGMMHRKMYDPGATKKLAHTKGDKTARSTHTDDGEGDIFAKIEGGEESSYEEGELEAVDGFTEGELLGEEEDEFDDLLTREEDEGLMDFLEKMEVERERLEIERETNEMLFGSGSDADEDEGEDMLLEERLSEVDGEGDSMLL